MNDQELENLVRLLKPAPLPEDLKELLAFEPQAESTASRKPVLLFFAAGLAAAVAVVAGVIFSEQPKVPVAPVVDANEEALPVSVVKTDSTLLNSRLLEVREVDGQLWEISEEKWRDDTLLLYTGVPSSVNSTAIRREIVCAPLQFQ